MGMGTRRLWSEPLTERFRAQYEYGPFGELIHASGPMAKVNLFRFSTKFQDDETGFLYYGYRYYVPGMGRWLSRDPIAERGGMNLYGFVRNCSIEKIDTDGREITELSHGGGIVGGVIKTREQIGQIVKGLIVGTFNYPRKGYCGCWRRNVCMLILRQNLSKLCGTIKIGPHTRTILAWTLIC